MRFSGSNALIVGGGSGIGLACARRLLAEGAAVTIAGRDESRLRRAAVELAAATPEREVRWLRCDVTAEDDVVAAVARATGDGGLHAVVTAAGTGWVAPVATIPLDAWRRVIDTNVTGAFLLLKHAAERLAATRGTFTAISSVNAVRTSRFHAPYTASKAALDMLVRTAADELGAAGIRVNAVRPGLVPTNLSSDLVADDDLRGDFVAQMPLARMGTADEVAAAVCFLASPEASWITGVCLPVDGGHHLRRGEAFDPWVRRQHPEAPSWWGIAPAGDG